MRAIYGQASELPASLFDLGISPHINASILVSILLLLPKEIVEWQPLDRLREARKEGKSVGCGRGGGACMELWVAGGAGGGARRRARARGRRRAAGGTRRLDRAPLRPTNLARALALHAPR